MEELFHVSDQPGITRFEPRPPPPGNTTHTGRMVWAVGQRLLHNYLVPRDCPRSPSTPVPRLLPRTPSAF